MTVKDVTTDLSTRSLQVVAEFDADPEEVWQLWADRHKLERWWGPPGFPLTVTRHDLVEGGQVDYVMTSAENERFPGWWEVVAVDPPRSLEVRDVLADQHGAPDPDLPVTAMRVDLTAQGDCTRMVISASFESEAELRRMLELDMAEGMRQAVAQADAVLAG